MDKLDEILENTRVVKKALVKETEEKKERKREQVLQAAKKFKQIKTNVKADFYKEIVLRVEELDTNVSNYIQTLIKDDLENKCRKNIVKNMSIFEFLNLKFR